MTDHAVGSKISLISKSEIRYEGYLHFINPDENTVALKNVRMFGTEGRKNGTGEIPANEQLYEFIIFRGADIKDLTVFEDQPQDPAIVSAKAAAPGAVESKPSRPLGDDWNTSGGRGRGGAPRRYESRPGDNRFERHREQRFDGGRGGDGGIDSYGGRRGGGGGGGGGGRFYDRRDNYGGGGGGGHGGGHHSGGGGHGGHGGHGGGRGGYDRPQRVEHTGREFAPSTDGKAKQEFSEDFDFAKAKQEFETKAHKEKDGSAKKSYDKTSSFFDTISCETSERIARGGRRPDNLREQRERQHGIDNETFGRDLVGQQQQRRRGGGRGRGRFGNRY